MTSSLRSLQDSRDMSNLLGRAGFTLLTVDVDEVKVNYPSMWELVEDLKDMGESNAVVGRRNYIHRDTLAAASAIYQGRLPDDSEERRCMSFIHSTSWKRRWYNPRYVPNHILGKSAPFMLAIIFVESAP